MRQVQRIAFVLFTVLGSYCVSADSIYAKRCLKLAPTPTADDVFKAPVARIVIECK
jgi:hypothetical protein